MSVVLFVWFWLSSFVSPFSSDLFPVVSLCLVAFFAFAFRFSYFLILLYFRLISVSFGRSCSRCCFLAFVRAMPSRRNASVGVDLHCFSRRVISSSFSRKLCQPVPSFGRASLPIQLIALYGRRSVAILSATFRHRSCPCALRRRLPLLPNRLK